MWAGELWITYLGLHNLPKINWFRTRISFFFRFCLDTWLNMNEKWRMILIEIHVMRPKYPSQRGISKNFAFDLNWLEFNLINSIFAGSSVHTFAHTYTRANAVELLQFSVNATFDRSQVIAQHIHLVFAIRPTYTTHTNARANAHTFRLCERETAFVFHRKSFHRYHQNRGAAKFWRTFPPIADYHTHENNNNHNIEKKWNSTQRYSY